MLSPAQRAGRTDECGQCLEFRPVMPVRFVLPGAEVSIAMCFGCRLAIDPREHVYVTPGYIWDHLPGVWGRAALHEGG